jgi:cytosine/adenosine deaminase-related metal-dependent hydrolase
VRLWWGALRNLLCGVTTVCHHNPLHAELLRDEFPIRVIADYGWAHSLAMEPAVEDRFRCTPSEAPFVIHACEGIDESSANEIFELDKLGVLYERTVLVHGLGLTDEGTALLNRRGAALVLCPSSNRFLFNRTHTPKRLASIERLLLGSDSPLTASGDLLDEIRLAHRELGFAAGAVYSMLFDNAPSTLQFRNGEGRVRPHAHADFFAVRDNGMDPADTLVTLSASDIELVIVRGRIQLASDEICGQLHLEARTGLQPLMIESQLRWVRAPLARMFGEAERVLGPEIKLGGRRVRHADTGCR